MHLLFLVGRDAKNPSVGGGDIQAWEWARFMADKGEHVTYICLGHDSLSPQETYGGVQVLRLGTGLALFWHAFRYYLSSRRGIDLVYEDVIGGSRPPFLSVLYARKPVVVAWHQPNRELFYDNYSRPIAFLLTCAEKALAWMYRRTEVRVPSEDVRQQVHKELRFPLERIHVIPASIPDEWFTHAVSPHAAEPNVVCISNLRRYKGIHTLIQAFPSVLEEYPGARLVIVGRPVEEEYEDYLRDLISKLGMRKVVELKLGVSEDEKRSLLRDSRVLVLPSRREGFGIVVLEANACGLPVVASSGVPESAVRHGYNGLRYPFGDILALSESILRLLKDENLYAQLSRNSIAFAREFGWRKVGAQFEDLVKLTMKRHLQKEAMA